MNPSGDRQTTIDVFANEVFDEALLNTGRVAEVASEELKTPRKGDGTLHITMDPLDGSSNVETNNPLGSIFGIYDRKLPCSGEHLISAAYVTYGPMLTLTLAVDGDVMRLTAVRSGSTVDFELRGSRIRIPQAPEVYGFGGARREWIPEVLAFVVSLERRGMKVRYCGTFVGDFNQILKHGGIFAYPALKTNPEGKLRILYETAPMAFIAKAAGGYASNGAEDILKVLPKKLSETSPVYIGGMGIVKELERALSGA